MEEQDDHERSKYRNYENWEGFNKFYGKGRIMTGPGPKTAIFVFGLLNVTAILTFAFPMIYYAIEGSAIILIVGVLLHITFAAFMIITCLTDPGYLPKYTDQEINTNKIDKSVYTMHKAWFIKLKYGYTGHIIRPPRTVHGANCNSGVERMDHHCPWLGCGVGKRNYTSFIIYIVSLAIYGIYAFIITITYCVDFTNKNQTELNLSGSKAFGETMKKSPLIFPLILFWFVAGVFVVLLGIYHLKLLYEGRTTHEDLKDSIFFQHPFNNLDSCRNFK